jgi:hypothetical protein
MDWKKAMRAVEAIGGLVEVVRGLRSATSPSHGDLAPTRPELTAPGQLEARLAGVVVAALKEAFDRDRARLDLERAHIDAERQRAEEMLRLELLRQAADRAVSQFRLLAAVAVIVWVTSAVLAVAVPGMRAGAARVLLGAGWAGLVATLGCAFAGHNHLAAWLARSRSSPSGDSPDNVYTTLAPWLLTGGLALSAASLLAGL